ncbi:MAG: iron-containing alcohol dehydrogenase [Oscillibacter sp.]|nr:iron-containing alcohol dehydrogenase [Oscillibacter sp.]
MNPLKAAYCRTFQTVFRLAIPLLPYRVPEELDSVRDIPAKLRELGVHSVLLVTDHVLRARGLTAELEQAVSDAGIRCHVYDRTVANPTIANAEEALTLYREGGCGALIGFGGGSAMDCAKAVGVQAARPRTPLRKLKGILKVHAKLPPLFAVPTTAGTGSETTVASILVDEKTKHKFQISDFCLIPRYAVLDAQVTVGLPPFFTATTGMDALTHAVEAYIGRSTTGKTRAQAIEAVQLVFRYLERAWKDGSDLEARHGMLRASYLAGAAFTVSYVGYCHCVAHTLGGMYNVPHGLANAVLLPYVLRAYGSSVYDKLKELAVASGTASEPTLPAAAAERFIREIEAMERRMNIPDKLPHIRESDIPMLSRYAEKEGNPIYPVPRLMDRRELERFYVMAALNVGETGGMETGA